MLLLLAFSTRYQHTYVRQHASACVSIRQHTSAYSSPSLPAMSTSEHVFAACNKTCNTCNLPSLKISVHVSMSMHVYVGKVLLSLALPFSLALSLARSLSLTHSLKDSLKHPDNRIKCICRYMPAKVEILPALHFFFTLALPLTHKHTHTHSLKYLFFF